LPFLPDGTLSPRQTERSRPPPLEGADFEQSNTILLNSPPRRALLESLAYDKSRQVATYLRNELAEREGGFEYWQGQLKSVRKALRDFEKVHTFVRWMHDQVFGEEYTEGQDKLDTFSERQLRKKIGGRQFRCWQRVMETLDEEGLVAKAFEPSAPHHHRPNFGVDGKASEMDTYVPEAGGEAKVLLRDEYAFLQEAVRNVLTSLPAELRFNCQTLAVDLSLLPEHAADVQSDPILQRGNFSLLSPEMRGFVGDVKNERMGNGVLGREQVFEEGRNDLLKRETLTELWEARQLQEQMAPYLLQLAQRHAEHGLLLLQLQMGTTMRKKKVSARPL
jgi:hypothetical protein